MVVTVAAMPLEESSIYGLQDGIGDVQGHCKTNLPVPQAHIQNLNNLLEQSNMDNTVITPLVLWLSHRELTSPDIVSTFHQSVLLFVSGTHFPGQ